MSREPREYCDSGVYHVMFRGSNKENIFLSDKDYRKFLELIQKIKEKKNFELYAYCLMSNHVHLVLKETDFKDVSDIMKRLIGEYTQWFNFKYEKSGSLTESRYKSKAVTTDEYFMHLIRYVHQNPVKAGIVDKIDKYLWSSYCCYLNKDTGLIDSNFLLEILPKHIYEEFHKENEINEFTLYHDDETDILRVIKNFGIDDVMSMKYMPEDKIAPVIRHLKEGFSLRSIERATGISRYKIKNM